MPKPNDYQTRARLILQKWLGKAFQYESKEMLFLASKWGAVENHLEDLIIKLSEKEILSQDQLFKMDLYRQFLAESKREVDKFNSLALGVIKDGQSFYGKTGIDIAQDTIGLVTVKFNRINFNAVNSMIGLSSQGSLLEDLFKKSYPDSVARLTNTLIQATAMGYNPKKTAGLLKNAMGGNLTRARVIARTEQMNVLRISSIQQMKESGVVRGWIRIEQPDCCDGCAEVNGKYYSFEEEWDLDYNHPNCRGSAIPDV